ncbi:oligosaccharide flippase family protein [Bacillus sp. AFS041924]|uniref:oligosaccharide flippase family protein n=1 Tax=Bacillus sp. AFS041924 TaxID=2033503 RepID=UPI00159BC71A|nr:oligosaccharide flippase family protein [Bacillus sp. AFS041924]
MKSLFYTISANLGNFILSTIAVLIIPLLLKPEQFSSLKTFELYLSYAGFFHLGFSDGFFINIANKKINEHDNIKIRSFMVLLLILVGTLSLILFSCMFIIGDQNIKVLSIFLLINIILVNLNTFISFVIQADQNFVLYSKILFGQKLVYVLGVIILLVLNARYYFYFMYLYTIINFIILSYYLYKFKKIFLGRIFLDKEILKTFYFYTKKGLIIMIGNLTTLSILGLDRIFINLNFTRKDFGIYSFAYTVVSMYAIVINSLSSVLYPTLARKKLEELNVYYKKLKLLIISLTLPVFISALIAKYILYYFFIEYRESIPIFLAMVPIVSMNLLSVICISNFSKRIGKQKNIILINSIWISIGLILMLLIKEMNSLIYIILINVFVNFVTFLINDFKLCMEINISKKYFLVSNIILLLIITGYVLYIEGIVSIL